MNRSAWKARQGLQTELYACKTWPKRNRQSEEIFELAAGVGFAEMKIKPFSSPSMVEFSCADWSHILENRRSNENFMKELRPFVWEDRVIFHMTRV
jgi:hypothetical protein